MAKGIIPISAMEKAMKKVGAKRVSESAKKALWDMLEENAELMSSALRLATHAKRTTIKEEDIKLASK